MSHAQQDAAPHEKKGNKGMHIGLTRLGGNGTCVDTWAHIPPRTNNGKNSIRLLVGDL